jgi:hypothetical protein
VSQLRPTFKAGIQFRLRTGLLFDQIPKSMGILTELTRGQAIIDFIEADLQLGDAMFPLGELFTPGPDLIVGGA